MRLIPTVELLCAVALVTSLAPAVAAPPSDVLAKYACSGCHAIDKKLVGPAFAEVADKYKTQKDARDHLSTRIRSGGSGLWGPVPMPPQAAITDAELGVVVDWLLAGAKP